MIMQRCSALIKDLLIHLVFFVFTLELGYFRQRPFHKIFVLQIILSAFVVFRNNFLLIIAAEAEPKDFQEAIIS